MNMKQISGAEIESQLGRFATAYDIIRALRPNMLISHGVVASSQSRSSMYQGISQIKIYLDGTAYEGSLDTIPAATVQEVRWLSPMDATTRYGTGNTAGAIEVTTRQGLDDVCRDGRQPSTESLREPFCGRLTPNRRTEFRRSHEPRPHPHHFRRTYGTLPLSNE
jgi:hypothetical protein